MNMTDRSQFNALQHPVIAFVSALTLLAIAPSTWGAEENSAYPSRPIRMISGPIGGMMDINARLIATELTKQMGQQVIVDNRPGAGGIIAMEIVARAAPDGYTVGQVASNFAANPSLYAKLPYDSEQDFQPVVYTGFSTLILAVTPALPIRSVKELLAHARANPGELSYRNQQGTAIAAGRGKVRRQWLHGWRRHTGAVCGTTA